MKIGAGGPQAQAAREASQVLDTARLKPPAEETLLQSEDLALRRMRYELNKAVEQMRRMAEMFNQPYDFIVRRGKKPRIKLRDRRTGAERELTLEEAEAWLEEMKEESKGRKGRKFNGYA